MTPKNKIKIKVTTSIPAVTINTFAFGCKRSYGYINKSIDEGKLNYAMAFENPKVKESGIKMVILDSTAEAFKNACKVRDKVKEVKV